ncbi:hypothetical protein GOACH_03_06270 [Gordonia aichiensis NBRC 108223]|uniref:Uncharacterized protein n=1 Tax=Gordonia aichiensis NBRC 108223 TaxID=1220583 RepID=L7KG67_9ACTN|nr:hypothetical protein GOACH_03_06270 [Gordonia aichiensis NBRC 108223]
MVTPSLEYTVARTVRPIVLKDNPRIRGHDIMPTNLTAHADRPRANSNPSPRRSVCVRTIDLAARYVTIGPSLLSSWEGKRT